MGHMDDTIIMDADAGNVKINKTNIIKCYAIKRNYLNE
jgi:hypothetical protein